jgi:hypothetical protein
MKPAVMSVALPAILGVELALLALLACSRDEHNIKVT